MKIFLDTSALAKRYVQEPGSEEMEALFMTVATEVSIATLAWPEFTAALARKVRAREIREESATGAFEEFERDWDGLFVKIALTESVAALAASLTIQHSLKGADAVHLASAIESNAALFVVSDQQLIKASENEGLEAYDPTAGSFSGAGKRMRG